MALTFDMALGEAIKDMPKGSVLRRTEEGRLGTFEIGIGDDVVTGDLWAVIDWIRLHKRDSAVKETVDT